MNKDNITPIDQPLETKVVEAARSVYTPPNGDAYWQTLELKVMSRIQNSVPTQWWQELRGWARNGIMAAAVAIVLIAALLFQANRQAAQTAYVEAIIDFDRGAEFIVPEGAMTQGAPYEGGAVRTATFRDVISR